MMAFRALLPWFLLVVFVAPGYPQDTSSSSEESSEDYDQELVEKYCPGETVDVCRKKVVTCFEEMRPNIDAEKEKEAIRWRQAFETCRKEEGGPILTNKEFLGGRDTMKRVHKCVLTKMKYLVDGQPNRPYLKEILQNNISNTTAEFQEAMLSAVDTCPVSDDGLLEAYYVCVTKACVANL